MSATTLTSTIPATVGSRLRWALADGWTLTRRNLDHLVARPGQIVATLLFPVIMVLLFGYVFGSAISVPGGGSYREYLMPGLFAMTSVIAMMSSGLAVATDKAKGVMDRLRTMPVTRLALPFGQTGGEIILGVISTALMAGCGLAVGWRAHLGIARATAAFGLVILVRYAVSWVGVYIGLRVKNEETADQLVPLVFPITMIANTFVPTGHMPTWLRVLADWNPASALTTACRELFGNPGAPLGHLPWPLQHPVPATLLWCAALLGVFVPLSARRFRTLGG